MLLKLQRQKRHGACELFVALKPKMRLNSFDHHGSGLQKQI